MCICKTCDCRTECCYYESRVQPVIDIVESEFAEAQFSSEPVEPYIKNLESALEGFECEYYEEERK